MFLFLLIPEKIIKRLTSIIQIFNLRLQNRILFIHIGAFLNENVPFFVQTFKCRNIAIGIPLFKLFYSL